MDIIALCREIRYEIGENPYLWQVKALQHVLDRRDTIVSAGTGSGKSLIFQGLCFAAPRGIVLVIVPLKTIITQQVTHWQEGSN